MKTPVIATILLVFVLFVRAAIPSKSDPVKACDLITAQEAEEVLGGKPNDPLTDVRGKGTCQWTTTDGKMAEMVILVGSKSTYNLVDGMFKSDKTYESLEIGDKGFLS